MGVVAGALKGKRLRGSGRKLAQREADYTSKGIHFAHLACTNSNKGARRRTQAAEGEGGGGGSRALAAFFFRAGGTFMTMLIKCFWDTEHLPHLCRHTRQEQLDWALGAVFMDTWINTLPKGLYLSLS